MTRTGKALLTALLLTALAAVVMAARLPLDAVEAHRYADGVLVPRFSAAFNDWTYQHPTDRPGHEGEHCEKLDAGDVKRWQEVRRAWKDLDAAMKRAGY